MNILVLKKFNNYFNRIIKKYDDLQDYNDASEDAEYLENINFNPNDGVRTELILGKGQVNDFFDFENNSDPDYLLCYDKDLNILSRWFILECERTRNSQYKLTLKRDTIADNLNTLITCPAYIKKGICPDDSPLILNDEGINVNQIKKAQETLVDSSGSAWIVGYMPKGLGVGGASLTNVLIPDEYKNVKTLNDFATEFGVDEADLANAITTTQSNDFRYIKNIEIDCFANQREGYDKDYIIATSTDGLATVSGRYTVTKTGAYMDDCSLQWGSSWIQIPGSFGSSQANWFNGIRLAGYWADQVRNHLTTLRNSWKANTGIPLFTNALYNALNDWVGKYIYRNGQLFQLRASNTVRTGDQLGAKLNKTGIWETACNNMVGIWNTWAHDHPGELIPSSYADYKLTARSGGKIWLWYSYTETTFYLTPASISDVGGTSFSMSASRNACIDQVYDMFAIPYNDITVVDTDDSTYTTDGSMAQRLAVAIAGAAQGIDEDDPDLYALYDLQLLPYCPIPGIAANGQIDLGEFGSGDHKGEHYDFDYITYTGEAEIRDTADVVPTVNEYEPQHYEATATYQSTVNDTKLVEWGWSAINQETEPHAQQAFDDWIAGISVRKTVVGGKSKFEVYNQVQDPQAFEHADVIVTFWFIYKQEGTYKTSVVIYPKTATFKATINKSLTAKDEMKIENLCNKYRLVSPNYQGSFDFNLAKNNGSCASFTANCTYKPYTPYIKVVPKLTWMYGDNYHDCRGLICGGDFSLGRVNSKWAEYQLNNKNYQNIFNREIQNLDVNQSIARTQQYTSGALNILPATIQGGATGAMMSGGNPYAAIAGAAVGGVMSGVGYGVDNYLMEKSLVEQKQFTIDKYKMQLGNIQAIPYTLTKVGSFDADSNIFPIIEYYTCTDEEKNYLRNKFRYEGYTIGVVDELSNYLILGNNNYCQAELIRNTSITCDNHQLSDINLELNKGVYM